jgi:hypothetical protein
MSMGSLRRKFENLSGNDPNRSEFGRIVGNLGITQETEVIRMLEKEKQG